MPRVPVIVQAGNFGTQNAAAAATGRSVPKALVKMPAGVAQLRSQFAASKTLSDGDARQLNSLQSAIAQATRLLKSVPFLDGNLIPGVPFKAIGLTTTVQHNLGRLWRGCFPVNVFGNGVALFAEPQGPNGTIGGLDARTIVIANTLNTTGTLDLWVY